MRSTTSRSTRISADVVLVACRDLLFRSRVEATLRHLGQAPLILRPADDPSAVLAEGRPAAVVVDLSLGHDRWRSIVAAARARTPAPPVLAFGPHVDREAQAEARASGCAIVVANSRLTRELPLLLGRLLDEGAVTDTVTED